MPRRITWVLLLALLLAPVLGTLSLGSSAFAQDETVLETPVAPGDGSPTVDVTPEGSPTEEISVTPEPSLTSEPTETETATETPTEVVTEVPTETPTGTPTGTPTATATTQVSGAGLVAASDLAITLDCRSNPEWFRVINNGTGNIQLQSITTLVDVTVNEPFASTRWLKPGEGALFQAGSAAKYGTVLSTSLIFTNSAYDAEGVEIVTSAGTATAKCAPKPPPVAPEVKNPGKLADISITVSCRTYAETIRVTNNGTGFIRLTGIETLYAPLAEEPYAIDRLLKPGQTALLQAGDGAQYGTVITKDYIFTNSVWEKDGVKVRTSAGNAIKACEKKPLPPEHWVDINLSQQYLRAYEGSTQVNATYVSTGRPGFDTPTGTYYIMYKYRYDDMEGTLGGEYYYVPAVPWTMYFTNYGHALHGAYWHNNFGNVMSHGCVNLPLGFAEWLYYWLPYGGRVVIHY